MHLNLPQRKLCPSKYSDIFSYVLFNNFNNGIAFGHFPCKLKFEDVSSVFKKGCKADKSNYRPVSILPVISKMYERLIFYQLNLILNLYVQSFNVVF